MKTSEFPMKTIQEEIKSALVKIKKFKKINNIRFNPKIVIDYKIDSAGFMYFDFAGKAIYLNPKICKDKTKHTRIIADGYIDSYTIYSVIMHEFSHYMDLFFDIKKDFMDISRTIINSNAKQSRSEEIAEVLTLFIINPYILKIINKECYIFIKSIFKSPTPCSKKEFIKIYNSWTDKIKEHAKNVLGIKVENKNIIVDRRKIKKFLKKD
jgi:predicted SprT family Zn-dependent metalloprotease